jgi:hypothetical protein
MSKLHRLQLQLVFLITTTLLLGACGGWTELTKEEKAKGSLLYLYIDTDDMAGHLDRVVFRQVKAGEEPHYYGCAIKKQKYVWFEGLPKGKYQLDNYGGMDGCNIGCMNFGGSTNYVYRFPAQGSGFEITDQKVYFLGAFRHKNIKGKGFFSADKFDLVPIKDVTPTEIFPVILKELQGSPLLPMAERYASKL